MWSKISSISDPRNKALVITAKVRPGGSVLWWNGVQSLILIFLTLSILPQVFAKPIPAYTEVALDYPLDGGGMLMFSRMWMVTGTLDAGLMGGGGVIERDLEVEQPGQPGLKAKTKAAIFPFIGPRLSLHGEYFGISVGYGFYYASTKFEVDGVNPSISSSQSAWGQGFYTPLLTLDFYVKKYDMVFGFGLGGFFGTSYPTLEAENSTLHVQSEDDPINTLTVHVRTRWYGGKGPMGPPDQIE